MVKSLAKEYEGQVEVVVYRSGVAKYGAVSSSLLVVNESKAVAKLSKSAVRKAFEEALKSA